MAAKKKAPANSAATANTTTPKKRGRPAKSYEMSSEAAFAKITKGVNLKKLSPKDLSKLKKKAYTAAKDVRAKAKSAGKKEANKEIREAKRKVKEEEAAIKAEKKALREQKKLEKAERDKEKNKVKNLRSTADKFEEAMSNPTGDVAKGLLKNSKTRTALAIYNEAIKSLYGEGTKTGKEAAQKASFNKLMASAGLGAKKKEGGSTIPKISQSVLNTLGGSRMSKKTGKKVTVRASAYRAILKVARSEKTLENIKNAALGVAKKKGFDISDSGTLDDIVRRSIARTVADVTSGRYKGKSGGRFVTKKGSGIAGYVIKSAKTIADKYSYTPKPRQPRTKRKS